MDETSADMSPAHWAIMLIPLFVFNILLFFWPVSKILKKMGYSGWSVLWTLLPGGMFVGLWVLALSKWPALERKDA
jgi:hypothetical protein